MKLPKSSTKEERKQAHKMKMMGKHFRRYEDGSRLPESPKERAWRLNMNKELGRK